MYGQRVVLINSMNVISFFSVAGLVDSETNFASSSGFSSLFVTIFPFLSPLKFDNILWTKQNFTYPKCQERIFYRAHLMALFWHINTVRQQ